MSNMNQQAAAESIAQSLATVIASTSDDQMSTSTFPAFVVPEHSR